MHVTLVPALISQERSEGKMLGVSNQTHVLDERSRLSLHSYDDHDAVVDVRMINHIASTQQQPSNDPLKV